MYDRYLSDTSKTIRVSVIPGITPSKQPSHQTAHAGSGCKHTSFGTVRNIDKTIEVRKTVAKLGHTSQQKNRMVLEL